MDDYTMNAVTRELEAVTKQAALICMTSGLPITNDLPALPIGLYLPAVHPLVSIVKQTLTSPSESGYWSYLLDLPDYQLAGALLAALSELGKLSLHEGSNAYATRLSILKTFNLEQLKQALTFIKYRLVKEKMNFSPLLVTESYLTPREWDAFVASAFKLDYYSLNAELEGWFDPDADLAKDQAYKDAHKPIATKSKEKQVKQLNADCWECFLVVSQYLPKATTAKAKPFTRQLASFGNSKLIDSFINGIQKYCTEEETETTEAMTAYLDLVETVTEARQALESLNQVELADFDLTVTSSDTRLMTPITAGLDLPDLAPREVKATEVAKESESVTLVNGIPMTDAKPVSAKDKLLALLAAKRGN